MRKLVFIQGTSAEPPTFADFVWGDPWSFTMPAVEGATFYVEHIGFYPGTYDVSIPQTFAYNEVGAYSLPGREYSGQTAQNSTLGPTRVWVDGWSALEEFYSDNVGVSLDVTVNTYFRLYWGEWEGELPAEFTAEDILGLTHGGVAGPSTRLCTTARNQELEFAATGTPKARIIVVPTHINEASGYGGLQAGKTMNTVRAADHTQLVLDPSADVPYQGSFHTGYNELVINGIQHWVYVVPATSSAFSAWLRFVEQEVRSLGTTFTPNPSFNPLGVCYRPGNWTFNSPCAQFDPATKLLVSVSALTNVSWSGSISGENMDAVPHVLYSTHMTTSVSFNLDGLGEFRVGTVSRDRDLGSFGAFDGNADLTGASGYQEANEFLSAGAVTTDLSSSIALFQGTGTVDFNLDRTETISILADGVEVFGNPAIFSQDAICSTVHSAFLQVTFTYFLL